MRGHRTLDVTSRLVLCVSALALTMISTPALTSDFSETVEYLVPRPELSQNVPSSPLLGDVGYVQVLAPPSGREQRKHPLRWGLLRQKTPCVEILFGTYGRSNEGSLNIDLIDTFGRTASEVLLTVDLANNEYTEVCFEDFHRSTVDVRRGGELTITATPSNKGGVSVWTTEDVRFGHIDGEIRRSLAIGIYEKTRPWSAVGIAAYPFVVLLSFVLLVVATDRHPLERFRWSRRSSSDTPNAALMSRGLPQRSFAILVFSIALMGVAGLSAAGISGSSISTYSEAMGQEQGLLLGTPKAIRSDEWMLHTPEKVRAAELLRFESQPDYMLIEQRHPPRAASRSPWALFQPHLWAYHLTNVERAFAFEWWFKYAIAFSGVVGLLAVAQVRNSIAALAGAAVVLSPALNWWTLSMGLLFVGYGTFASACLSKLILASRFRERLLYSAGALYFGIAFAVTEIYPPWQIPLAWILVAAVVSVTLRGQADMQRKQVLSIKPWAHRVARSALWVLPVFISAGIAFALTAPVGYFGERLATEYPGNRSGLAGGGAGIRSAASALVEPLHNSLGNATINGLSQSENAAGFPLVFVILALLAWRLVTSSPRKHEFWATMPLFIVTAVLVAWVHLQVPSDFGRIFGLDRVQPARALMPLAVLVVLYLALSTAENHRPPRVVTALTLIATTVYAGFNVPAMEIVPEPPSGWPAYVMLVGSIAVATLLLHGQSSRGFALLVALSLVVWAPINPVQRGLSVLVESPLRALVHDIEADGGAKQSASTGARWLVVGELNQGVIYARSVLVASGVDVFPVTQSRPSREVWGALDPAGAHVPIWNRQARIVVIAEDGPRFTRQVLQPNLFVWGVDLCASEVRALSITHVVSNDDLIQSGFACLGLLKTLELGNSLPALRIYELS